VKLFLDIETTTDHKKIWCCFTYDDSNGYLCHTKPDTLTPLIASCETVIAHNLIGFDGPVLKRCWGVTIPARKAKDTLILSRLYNPNLDGGHSLKAWGERVGEKKIDYEDLWKELGLEGNCYDNPYLPIMKEYCQQDVAVLVKAEQLIDKMLDEAKFSDECRKLEHDVAIIIQKQHEHGFKLDIQKAQGLLATLSGKMVDIENQLQDIFPPTIEEMKKPEYWEVQIDLEPKGRETLRFAAETKTMLKELLKQNGYKASLADTAYAGPMKTKSIPFNPGSRQQIAERLQGLGVKFSKTTDKGSIIVDEKVLEKIDLPEAKALLEYLMLQKRVAQVSSWLEEVKEDGRVHGRVNTNGAVTGRMTHSSPNMAQVPNSGSVYGPECRELWTVDKDNVLVGADASGLELRMLAHYMKDESYVKTVCEGSSKDGTDVHTINQKAANLQTRDQAKTFIYAFLYGAGAAKIGSIVGGSSTAGQKLITSFLEGTPALKRLRDKVALVSSKGYVPGLDGRKIWVRSEHAALNSLLQGAGAIVMKKALVLLSKYLHKHKIVHGFCANVHDEWQIETKKEYADVVGKLAVQSIEEAGVELDLFCPVSGEYNVGTNWKETH
jgi:DNA polymerase I-like protein with 3'-5' exonuclease and polymerase domains